MWMTLRVHGRWIACGALLGALACRAPGAFHTRANRAAREGVTAHAFHNEQIAAIMRDLDRFTWDRLPREMDIEGERNRRLDELAAAADAMAAAAARIPDSMDEVALSDAHRAVFVALADTLRQQALALRARAEADDFRQTAGLLDEIQATCASCHALFRDPPLSR